MQLIDLADTTIMDSGWNRCSYQYDFLALPYNVVYSSKCNKTKLCNWNSTCTQLTGGPGCCKLGNSSCMMCHDPLNCQIIPAYNDSVSCEANQICIPVEPRPDVYALKYVDINSTSCTSSCSHYCYDPVCIGAPGCESLDIDTCQNCKLGGLGCPGVCYLKIARPCNETECETYVNLTCVTINLLELDLVLLIVCW